MFLPDREGLYITSLVALKESQVFSVDDYKGWYHKVGSRFKPGLLEETMRAAPQTPAAEIEKRVKVKLISKRRMLELVQAAKRGDPDWRSKAEDWLLEAKER
jgi:hypothetical protein